MNTCASDTMTACDYLLVTTGIPNAVWLGLCLAAIVVGAVGLVASHRLMRKGRTMRRAAKAARAAR